MRYLIMGAAGVLAGFAVHRLSRYENPGSMDAIIEATTQPSVSRWEVGDSWWVGINQRMERELRKRGR